MSGTRHDASEEVRGNSTKRGKAEANFPASAVRLHIS